MKKEIRCTMLTADVIRAFEQTGRGYKSAETVEHCAFAACISQFDAKKRWHWFMHCLRLDEHTAHGPAPHTYFIERFGTYAAYTPRMFR